MISPQEVSCGVSNDKSPKVRDSLYLVERNISPSLLAVVVVPGRSGTHYKYELSVLHQFPF